MPQNLARARFCGIVSAYSFGVAYNNNAIVTPPYPTNSFSGSAADFPAGLGMLLAYDNQSLCVRIVIGALLLERVSRSFG